MHIYQQKCLTNLQSRFAILPRPLTPTPHPGSIDGWTPRFSVSSGVSLIRSDDAYDRRRRSRSALFSRQTSPPNICTPEFLSRGESFWCGMWFVPGAVLSLGGVEVPLKMQVRLEFRLGMLLELVLDVLDLELWYDCYNLICIELV